MCLDSLNKGRYNLKNVIENRLNRAEVPAELTWDLSDLYNSDAEWHTALNALENDIQKLDSFKGHLHTSSHTLLNCLLLEEELLMTLTKLYSYANLKEATDRTNQVFKRTLPKFPLYGRKYILHYPLFIMKSSHSTKEQLKDV